MRVRQVLLLTLLLTLAAARLWSALAAAAEDIMTTGVRNVHRLAAQHPWFWV